MPVKVFLSSVLRQYIPGYDPLAGIEFTLDGKMTVSELCKLMNIPQDRVKIVMVNGMSKPFDFVLRGDERVGLFPPLGGG
ncbi:MAG: MoaD/ThiS family protein [Proteobacteria bacterium]|jgi:molybdopterin synthase sulfur carrier subunit|nr:MoaD/ThiS family protein [Pseudomonadota bacterium]